MSVKIDNRSKAEILASLPKDEREAVLKQFSPEELQDLLYDWGFWGRRNQQLPLGDWFVWLILAGRGFGKTRTAVETIAKLLRGSTPLTAPPGAPKIMSIIADSPFDMRQYTIEGPSGFLNVGPPDFRPIHEPSKKTLTWPNGCKALLFSAEDPEELRGASGEFFWWDELAKSRYADEGWSNLLFGMREGNPRGIVTTTPRPIKLMKELIKLSSTHVTRGSTWDNRSNLSQRYFDVVIRPLMGTRRGRQEIDAEILDDVPGALWNRGMIESCRAEKLSPEQFERFREGFRRVVVAMDPATTGNADSDEMGMVVGALHENGKVYLLEDITERCSPDQAAVKAIKAYDKWEADRIVGEVNNGGDWIGQTIRLTAINMHHDNLRESPEISYRSLRASRGKYARAEPVSALYEQGKVFHMGSFPTLEDQLCEWEPGAGLPSPDRLDAVVWLVTELLLTGRNDAGQLTMAAIGKEETESVLFK